MHLVHTAEVMDAEIQPQTVTYEVRGGLTKAEEARWWPASRSAGVYSAK